MRLRRKTSPTTLDQSAVTAFWRWWAESGHSIDPARESPAVGELTRLIGAIHPGLVWHFGRGTRAQYCLAVSAGGVAAVRPTAERWLRAAPPADATWEFRSSNAADPAATSGTLEIAGERLDLRATSFQLDVAPEELRVHVGVHHPAFVRMLPDARAQVTYLVLDWVLGEDDVERWVGHVEPMEAPSRRAVQASDLIDAIAELRGLCDPDEWSLARWQDDRRFPGVAVFRRGLRWVDHPTFDRHQLVSLKYRAKADGLPADEAEFDALREVEDGLISVLGSRGIVVGHESHRGTCRIHAYTDGEDQNVEEAVRSWAKSGGLSVTSSPDPSWTQVRHFTG